MKKIVNTANGKTYCGYVRPEPRNPGPRQRAAIEMLDLGKFPIYEEATAHAPGFPHRTAMINARRKGCNDVVIVSEMHRLAPDAESLRVVLKQLRAKDVTVLEATTGRYSGTNGTMEEMVLDAVAWYRSKGLTAEAAAQLGRFGAAASPVTKPLEKRMPVREALVIWRNPAFDTESALNNINADQRYDDKYSMSSAYRHLKQRGVGAGRPPKTKST
jgi:hypothetical protein